MKTKPMPIAEQDNQLNHGITPLITVWSKEIKAWYLFPLTNMLKGKFYVTWH